MLFLQRLENSLLLRNEDLNRLFLGLFFSFLYDFSCILFKVNNNRLCLELELLVVLELALLRLGRGTLLQSYQSLSALLGGVFEDLVSHDVIRQEQLKSIIEEVMQLKQLIGVRKSKDPLCIFS